MDWPNAIIHVDMDTFFVSVERRHDPSLIGKPVIVGGGRDGDLRRGVVAACSYETRTFGVHSAMPLAQAMRLCPEAIIVPVGRSNYGEYTAQVRTILESFTDLVEMASPDEAYIDLRGTDLLHGEPIGAARSIRSRIATQTGLPVSIGLATTRTHAKIASKLSKPSGLFVIVPGGEAAIVRPLSIGALPGLGPKTAKRLNGAGIRTLGQLIDAGEERLVRLLGDHGASYHRRAIGRGSAEVTPSRERVQISTEATFGDDIGEREIIHGKLARMTMKLGSQLRKREQWAGTLTLKIRYPDFTTLTRREALDPRTNDDTILYRRARDFFDRIWDGETPLRLLGVGVANMGDATQGDMFEDEDGRKRERLLQTLDSIGAARGNARLIWGSALEAKKSPAVPRDKN